jgi:hypothetical protein
MGAWGTKVEPKRKACTHCGGTKAPANFPPNKRTRDGLSSWCRSCHNEATQQWRALHPNYDRRRHRGGGS